MITARSAARCLRRVRCNGLLGVKLVMPNRYGPTNQLSRRKTANGVFVPIHPCADGVTDNRHAFLDVQRLGENRVPPVRVLQPMRCRGTAKEASADLREQVVRHGNAFRVRERRGPEPAGHPADLHDVRHGEVTGLGRDGSGNVDVAGILSAVDAARRRVGRRSLAKVAPR